MRTTGGNRFIEADSDRTMLLAAITRGVDELVDWADRTGRKFDPGAITVDTKRIKEGRICVTVEGDLKRTTQPHGTDRAPDTERSESDE